MCHLAPRGVPILDQWRGLDTAGQLDQDIDYGCKIKTPAQKIFLCRFSGLFSGEVPPFLALCSQGIRVKAVLTTTDMHQLNPDKCRATSVDKHGMSMVLSHKCLQHFKLAPKPTEQKARGFFCSFQQAGGWELPLEPFSQVSHSLVDLSGFITSPDWGFRAPTGLSQSSSVSQTSSAFMAALQCELGLQSVRGVSGFPSLCCALCLDSRPNPCQDGEIGWGRQPKALLRSLLLSLLLFCVQTNTQTNTHPATP